jgi:hypothetical protein
MSDHKLPGVTLWWEKSEIKRASGPKMTVAVSLTAQIEDEGIWQTVQQKLVEGLRIYTVDDFKGEMIVVLNEEIEKERAKTSVLQHRVQQLEYERGTLSVEVASLRKLRDGLASLAQARPGMVSSPQGESHERTGPEERTGEEGGD